MRLFDVVLLVLAVACAAGAGAVIARICPSGRPVTTFLVAPGLWPLWWLLPRQESASWWPVDESHGVHSEDQEPGGGALSTRAGA